MQILRTSSRHESSYAIQLQMLSLDIWLLLDSWGPGAALRAGCNAELHGIQGICQPHQDTGVAVSQLAETHGVLCVV